MFMHSAPFSGALLLLCFLLLFTNSIYANPVGELESNGQYSIRSSHSDQFVTFKADHYAWFSGDTLRTRQTAAVLNLDGGGGFGFGDNTQASVGLNDQGTVAVGIDSGSMIYALPDASSDLQIQAGNFRLSTRALNDQSTSSPDPYVGTVEHLADGNIKISIRSGELLVQNGDAFRHRVAAGESVGLLDLPQHATPMQVSQAESASTTEPLIEIESPEEVETGERFRVEWRSASSLKGDYVVIAKDGAGPDEFESVASTLEGEILNFTAPGNPGDYEIRFIDAETGAIKQRVPLEVTGSSRAGYVWDRAAGLTFTVAAGAIAVELIDEILDSGDDRVPVSP